jgi:hypothetical protein
MVCSRAGFSLLLSFVICSALTAAQNAASSSELEGKPSAVRTKHRQESVDLEQFIAYWTTEPGWRSELQLKNNGVGHDLTVTPVLRTPDGAETGLAPVTIKPQEVNLPSILMPRARKRIL